MRVRAALVCFLVALTASSAPAFAAKLVYRVDRATASVVNNRLVINATGVVRSGGWVHPTLRVRDTAVPEVRTLEIDFVATPPRRGAVVVQAILPVSTTLKAHLPRYGIAEVKIVTQTNSMTVPITPQSEIRRSALHYASRLRAN